MLEFTYMEWEVEKTLTIDSHVWKITEDMPNPSWSDDAYYYSLTINGMTQITTFAPGKEWFQAMTESEALEYLEWEIKQTKENFNIK